MPRQATATGRANEFPEHFFEDHGFLMCRFCDKPINYNIKSTITTHINSSMHFTNKKAKEQREIRLRQQTLFTSIDATQKKKETILDLVEAFVNANILLEKVDNLRPWLKDNLINGGSIPSAEALRQSYLTPVYEKHIATIKSEFFNKPVSFIVDETTDDCARSVVNILFSHQNVTKLVSVDFLNDVNNTTVGQLILRTLVEWSIPLNATRLFVSDSASYMKKCYQNILKPVMPQIIHMPCIAHILNLIGEAWTSIAQFNLVKSLLADIQQSVSRCKSQRSRYLAYLRRHGVEKPQKFPLYNKTRWSSWFRLAFYVMENLDYIRRFYREEKNENSSPAVEKIVETFDNLQHNFLVEVYLRFIKYFAQVFVNDLDFFQTQNLPVFPYIESRIEQLGLYIQNNQTSFIFPSDIHDFIITNNYSLDSFLPIFQNTFQIAYKKYTDHIQHHPARPLFQATQIFNPPFIRLSTANRDIHSYRIISELDNPSSSLMYEWSIYCNFELETIEYDNLGEFWEKISEKLPELSKIAQEYIWLPISSCAVERSFSNYNNILADNRQNLKLESLQMLNIMYFNQDR